MNAQQPTKVHQPLESLGPQVRLSAASKPHPPSPVINIQLENKYEQI